LRRLRALWSLAFCAAATSCAKDFTGSEQFSNPGGVPFRSATTYLNPVHAGDFPDPFVLRLGDVYYAYGTNVGHMNIPVMSSTDLAVWRPIGDALPQLPAWAAAGRNLTWAPSVIELGGQWVLYYTARDAALGLQCVGRAVASGPTGPFVDSSTEPFVCQPELGGSIDPSPFVDGDGSVYLLWKSDGNCCKLPVGLYGQRLSADGGALVGDRALLLPKDQQWEGDIVEAPSMWLDGGVYYLFYSANWYKSARYAVGYGICSTPLGPCSKPGTAPVLSSAGTAAGTGGQSLVQDQRGNTWMAYHAGTAPNVSDRTGGVRSLRVDRVRFEGGAPFISGPTTTPQGLE
jgi:beta-xylosidase